MELLYSCSVTRPKRMLKEERKAAVSPFMSLRMEHHDFANTAEHLSQNMPLLLGLMIETVLYWDLNTGDLVNNIEHDDRKSPCLRNPLRLRDIDYRGSQICSRDTEKSCCMRCADLVWAHLEYFYFQWFTWHFHKFKMVTTRQKCDFLPTFPNRHAARQCFPEFGTKRNSIQWEVLRHRGYGLDLPVWGFNIFERLKKTKTTRNARWTTLCRRLEVV
jgi:hypothetical protein